MITHSDRTWRNSLSRRLIFVAMLIGTLLLAAVLVWQAITSHGNPDPTAPNTSAPAAALNIAILVFREGLECILVLTAIIAGLMGANRLYRRPIGIGVILGGLATLVTWFIAVTIIDDLTEQIDALSIQAATGMLAIIVLLVVMNWFFHKVYWTGWISLHNRKKKNLIEKAQEPNASGVHTIGIMWGLIMLGFTSLYREGFEVVLFLQSYRLRMGEEIVLYGALLGLLLTGIVAVLNFVAHHRLPYKKMLIITGVLLAGVLFVMVGEEINEMQLAGWIGTTEIAWLQWLPDWAGLWFSIFPNWETIIAQVLAMVLVLGSYFLAQYQAVWLPVKRGLSPFKRLENPPAEHQALPVAGLTPGKGS